ncbi:phage minor head protein [Capnocytophaga canis]|uniref:phage minor head protein n=1 Tax=Capnocytophaga canis TaxID=1848903 RepID=UPI00370D611E
MEQIAKDRWEGKLKKGELSDAYILKTYQELNGALSDGFKADNFKVNKATGKIPIEALQMQRNLFKFSGAKNYAVLEHINQILTSDKGKNWNAFKNEVLKLNPKYNKNYLQAEWQTAKQAGYHAANWQAYQDNKALYPNLKYQTQKDNKVREAHQALQGIIAPIDSDFWKTHYPPNGWRCRCYVVQTAEPPTEGELPVLTDKEFPKEFRGNVGISGEVFKETDANKGKPHPYFALSKEWGSETKKAFEYSKLATPYTKIYEAKNGAEIKVSPFADESDLQKNVQTAVVIADELGVGVNIRADINTNILQGSKNPEYEINGKLADRKEQKGKNVSSNLKSAKNQGCKIVVFDIQKEYPFDIEHLKRNIKGQIKQHYHTDTFEEIIIIDVNKKMYERIIISEWFK